MRIEALEDRQLLATFTVTHPGDTGFESLRWAIGEANTLNNTFDTIEFNIDPAVYGTSPTIQLQSPLPTITDPACRYRPLFRTALCDNAGLAA